MNEIKLRDFLDQLNIDYIDSGKNHKAGNLNIQCPWCGNEDPSYHGGINFVNDFYYCWRNSQHKSSIKRLFKKLLNSNYTHYKGDIDALEIGDHDKEDFQWASAHNDRCVYPDNLSDIGVHSKHFRYLYEDRKFFERTGRLIQKFKLKRPDYEWQIFIPYYEHGNLVTYTLRQMGNFGIRYKTLAKNECIYTSQETLFGFDQSMCEGKTLLIVEGPFDCMKVSVLGEDFGIGAVALSGKNLTDRQCLLVQELSTYYEKVHLVLDQDTDRIERLQLLSKLSRYCEVTLKEPFPHVKDPGELVQETFHKWMGLL